LVLAPTRELALQVSSHLNSLLTSIEFSKDPAIATDKDDAIQPKTVNTSLKNLPPHVSVAAIVGGMSAQKQKRILDRGVDVLVATPGRLWDIMQDVSQIYIFLV
jgi:ATP-dependent RNA helicase DDX24/MAK5